MSDRSYQAVLFDMDGLLLDTESIYTQVTQEIVGQWGRVFDWSIKQHMIGRDSGESATYLVETLELPITGEDYLRMRDPMLREAFKQVEPMPGAETLVRSLKSKGVPIAVATSSSQEFFDLKQSQHAWFELFDTIVTSSHAKVQRAKPAPDIFMVAAAQLGVPANQCVVFEDAPSGLQAAKAAGAACVCVPDPNMDRSQYAEADLILNALSEFPIDEWF